MTADEYEKLPPEEKEHFARVRNAAKYLAGAAWSKSSFTLLTGHSVFGMEKG